MTSTLQNRIVGTFVVVALVVILVPEVLDGEKRTNTQNFVEIPTAPDEVEVLDVEIPDSSNVANQASRPVEVLNDVALDDKASNSNGSRSEQDSGSSSNVGSDGLESEQKNNGQSERNNSDTQQSNATVDENNPGNANNIMSEEDADESLRQGENRSNDSTADASNDPLRNIDIQNSGWVVQLGSFRHEKNVKELMRTLKEAGYRAYSRPVMTSSGELTKVFVGPELEKSTLEQALPHLQEITRLKGKITAFEVSAG